jgi:hypothetical protein
VFVDRMVEVPVEKVRLVCLFCLCVVWWRQLCESVEVAALSSLLYVFSYYICVIFTTC